MTPAGGETADIRDYFRVLRRRAWILLVCLIVIPGAIYLYTSSRPKVFQASTLLQVDSSSVDSSITDFSQPQSNIQAVAAFVSTSAVSDEAARRLGAPPGSLFGAAQAEADTDTGFITLSATGPTAPRAVQVTNAFAAALNAARERRGRQRIGQAISQTQEQLASTPKSDVVTRGQLTQQLQKLQVLNQAQSQNLTVLQPATGASQIAPHPRRNAVVGVILAFLIGAALIALAERLDRRVHKADDLEGVAGVPFLAAIPEEAFATREADPAVLEAFQTLRNSLTYFNVEGDLKTLAVVSSLKGEGKTTVALHLAAAYAGFGKNVVLVDTDLRKPDIANRLGLGEAGGLSQVLIGSASLDEVLREVTVNDATFSLLPGGTAAPNPSALIGSTRMKEVIAQLSSRADVVVIDTTPLLVVSDAFPLLDQVSGILALARLDQSPRDAIRRMVQVCSTAGGRILGVVATGGSRTSDSSYGYGHGYGYGYGSEPRKRRGFRRGGSAANGVPVDGKPHEQPLAGGAAEAGAGRSDA